MVVSIKDKYIDAVNAAPLTNKLLQMAYSSVYNEDKIWFVSMILNLML